MIASRAGYARHATRHFRLAAFGDISIRCHIILMSLRHAMLTTAEFFAILRRHNRPLASCALRRGCRRRVVALTAAGSKTAAAFALFASFRYADDIEDMPRYAAPRQL